MAERPDVVSWVSVAEEDYALARFSPDEASQALKITKLVRRLIRGHQGMEQ
jgi:hypothetical protein